ncbi:hypothetical protein IFM89_025983 [Coptis chinensis]|uniref:BSD domain-containing protein n=1 Tax=Coptis chinensis TaxID=261450 RepID=A0A835I3I6_9MAGN|nr:hypothetical protein IFM89_025983 [Coptis chinensis]
MDFSSWFRKTLLKNHIPKPTQLPTTPTTKSSQNKEEEEELGITEQLQNFIKSFTLETFKNYSLQDGQKTSTSNGDIVNSSDNNQQDLSEWQEGHATLVLSKVKEISQLRYVLCPRHLKEREFWRIYFALVKNYVTPYEIRAIQKAKVRRIGKEDEKIVASAYEVEMAETKGAIAVSPSFEEH